MFGRSRSRFAAGITVVGVVLAASVLSAAPANADPGDASAEGASALLDATVLGFPVVSTGSSGAISVAYPDSDSATLADVTLVGDTLADITLDVVETSASSDAAGSRASAEIAGASLNVLGIEIVTVEAATALATCEIGAAPTAAADVLGLTVLGDAATVDVGTPVAEVESEALGVVDGIDLTDLRLFVTVAQVETVDADAAIAVSLIAAVGIRGTFLGQPLVQALGAVALASAACETPAVVPITAITIDPAVGPTVGGQTVTITGTGFTPQTTVSFGANPATGVTVDPTGTSLTAVTPAGPAGPATVTVANPGSTATLGYTYVEPAIATISPTSGPDYGGTMVTISGQGLGTTPGVTFGGVPATIVSASPDGTQVVVTSPPGTGTVDVVVTGTDGSVTAEDGFTYVAPAVMSIDPASGPVAGGTTVTISGSGLEGTARVLFDGIAGTIVGTPSDTQVVVTTPAHAAGLVDVTIELRDELAADDIVAEDGFRYVAAPVATGATPDRGPAAGGTVVVVDGSGFEPGATTVTICGITIPADRVTVDAQGTRLTFTTPACDPGASTIAVTTAGGTTGTLPFRYIASTPSGGGGGALANTGGASASPLLATSLALLLLGAAAVSISVRRRRA